VIFIFFTYEFSYECNIVLALTIFNYSVEIMRKKVFKVLRVVFQMMDITKVVFWILIITG
jgi:hypothetical protein